LIFVHIFHLVHEVIIIHEKLGTNMTLVTFMDTASSELLFCSPSLLGGTQILSYWHCFAQRGFQSLGGYELSFGHTAYHDVLFLTCSFF
jgi:hypothetical protein